MEPSEPDGNIKNMKKKNYLDVSPIFLKTKYIIQVEVEKKIVLQKIKWYISTNWHTLNTMVPSKLR